MKADSSDHVTTTAAPWLLKAVNYMAATLGIGSFLGFVNVAVGVLSAFWLALQVYGYIRYELPIKHYRREQARRAAERGHPINTDFGALGADE